MCNKEKFWPALCACLGRDEWSADPRFARFGDRLEHRDLLTELLDAELGHRNTEQWLARFAGKVPAAPVYDIAQALDNPFVTEQSRLQTLEHPTHGPYRLVAPPVKSDGDEAPARPAPRARRAHRRDTTAGGIQSPHRLRDCASKAWSDGTAPEALFGCVGVAVRLVQRDEMVPAVPVLDLAKLNPGDLVVQLSGQRAGRVVVDDELLAAIGELANRRDDRGGTRTEGFLQNDRLRSPR